MRIFFVDIIHLVKRLYSLSKVSKSVGTDQFFGYHILWPEGFDGPFEWKSAVIAVAAGIALFRYNINVMKVISACALVGLTLTLLGFA